jgi:KaiC/GvpD/RAD55 family RecA-like ATPase
VHVLLGEPMNALELMAFHFAAAGTQSGGGSAFVTTEMEEDQVRAGVETVGGRKDRLHVVTIRGHKKATAIPEPSKGLRLVVDSFSTIAIQAGWEEAMGQLSRLRAKMRQTGDVMLLTASTGLHTEQERTLLKQWADGVLELGFDRQGFGLYPYLKVTKMRGVADSARFLLFKETEKGLFMESTKRVF